MPYRLFIPGAYDGSQSYPLIVWLHGAGGAGSDNLRQIQGDQIPGTRIWTTPENQTRHPAFVMVPQARGEWDYSGYPYLHGKRSDRLTAPLLQVLGIVESLQKEFRIDSSRIYVAGQSAGGFGAWNLITKKPGVFAAAIILCGGGNPDLAERAKDLPIWSFQGRLDREIRDSNRRMIAAVEKAGGRPRYTEYTNLGHDIWDRVFQEPGLVEWVFAQHR